MLRDGTNLQLDNEGGVTVTYIEEFPSDYYDVTELEAMNAEEVAEYNAKAGEEAVTVVSTTTDGSKITRNAFCRYGRLWQYERIAGIQRYRITGAGDGI